LTILSVQCCFPASLVIFNGGPESHIMCLVSLLGSLYIIF
jgi:hypothetical protein